MDDTLTPSLDALPQDRNYCEWVAEPDRWLFNWGEPLNTITNIGFIVVGLWALYRAHQRYGNAFAGHWDLYVLGLLIFLIGCGSWIFHQTQQYVWADVIPIILMLNGYLMVWSVRISGWRMFGKRWPLIPLSFVTLMGLSILIPLLLAQFISAPSVLATSGYFGALVCLFGIGFVGQSKFGDAALVNAAVLFTVSLAFRAADLPTCEHTHGFGVHTIWHFLNATCFFLAMSFLFRRVPATR